ncbi:ribosomal protein L34Ae [Artemisia annua]|uniref:Ribosomal protein L34Ae n=1 Tax=Artemisia annua TaxID=35608 RepID=A0A2U1M0F6_ARTAN|nr:ribosomal protein L34Ae [Artemisia annua]
MDSVLEFLWFYVSAYFLQLLNYITRFVINGGTSKVVSSDLQVELKEPMEEKSEKLEYVSDLNGEKDGEKDDEKEDENEFSFTFKFPTFEEFSMKQKNVNGDVELTEVSLEANEVDSNANDEVVLDEFQLPKVSFEASEVISSLSDGFVSDESRVVDTQKGSVIVSDDDVEDEGASEYVDMPKVSFEASEVNLSSNERYPSDEFQAVDTQKGSVHVSDNDVDDQEGVSEHVDLPKNSSEVSEVNSSWNDMFVSEEVQVVDTQKGAIYVSDDDTEDQESVSEYIDSPEASVEASEVKWNTNDVFVSNVDARDRLSHVWNEDYDNHEGVDEPMIIESLNEKKIGGVEEKEETDIFNEEEMPNDIDESFSSSPESNLDSISSNTLDSPTSDSNEDGFLSDGYFEVELDELERKVRKKSDFLSETDFVTKSRNITEPEKTNANVNANENENENILSTDDAINKLESLWEHQELIEQLEMEIKKVKAIGLPTIYEESESPPKIMEELKPWKIEEAYQHGGGGGKMSEVHKFYKTYRERMRKFDIFSYQKMYAIGFLQLKDIPRQSSSNLSSLPEITTLLSQSFRTNKGKKNENDPTTKFIKELQSDLEVVYVGQMCLSWEILHWQYEKALDIWESDPRGVRRFNEISGEFQQFQVLMQRFIEDEPFKGPRIQNYVMNRCVFRNLLQVPVIRDDHSKKKAARSEAVYDITSEVLVEILEESIRLFWRFVRADKYKRQTPVEFQRPEDQQLFVDLQKDLHKVRP